MTVFCSEWWVSRAAAFKLPFLSYCSDKEGLLIETSDPFLYNTEVKVSEGSSKQITAVVSECIIIVGSKSV